jgi:superfamily II DNA or RNA helicase
MELLPYQKTAVRDLVTHKRWALWASTGTGKSAMFVSACREVSKNILIICPKSLKVNWQREIDMWDPESSRNYTVISKEELKKHLLTLPYYDTLVADEVHYFSMFKSQLHKSLIAYCKKYMPPYVFVGTATPIMASVWSVWGLSRILGRECMNWFSFRKRFFADVSMGFGTVSVQRKGIEKDVAGILTSIGTVIDKDTVLDLPEELHEYEYFNLTSQQQKEIEKLDEDPTTATAIVYHTKCLQISNGTLKQIDGTYKTIKCDKITRVKEIVEQYSNIIIVCRQKAELEMLHKELKDSYVYNGDTPVEERQKIIDTLKESGGVLLLQSDVGVGFNAQFMNVMVFYSHSWSYVNYSQSLGRISRIGQNKSCIYIHLVTSGTVDESVVKCLGRKEDFSIELYKKPHVPF